MIKIGYETLTWILGVPSLSLGILSVVLAIVLTNITNKTIKTEDARAKEMLERMDRRAEQSARETKEMLERMDQRTEKLLGHISDLIVADGERVRELIKTG